MSRARHTRLALPLLAATLLAAAAPGLRAGDEPVNRSLIAFTLEEKDLLPENVAFDPSGNAFFVGSTRKGKIVRVGSDGRVTDFVAPRAHGLWMVIGMKADPARRTLWVASSDGGNLERPATGTGAAVAPSAAPPGAPAGLFAFDLDTGALRTRHVLDDPGATHFLNDLVVTSAGDVYVTHMFDAAQVWKRDAATGTFAPFYRGDSGFRNPNGLCLESGGAALYVAHSGAISRIDLGSRERRALELPEGQELGGVDGLYRHGDDLVAVQPGRKRVVRLRLAGGHAVRAIDVLEAQHPLFDEPTTGVLVGDWLYYVANAQFDRFDAQGVLFPPERLYQPVILKLKL